MINMTIKNITKTVIKILLLFTVVGFQACSEVADAINQASGKDVHSAHVNIEVEPIFSTYVDDINSSESYKNELRNYLSNEMTYLAGDKKGQNVDNNIYNFLIDFSIVSHVNIDVAFREIVGFDVFIYIM